MKDNRVLVAYRTHLGTYNLFREPLGEHTPSQATPVKLNLLNEWEVRDYVDSYPVGHRLIHWR